MKSPKVYVRDSGLVHALLGIGDKDTLVSHPVLGASWEGFVVEQVLAAAPEGATGHFYRTSAGAEIDLLLHLPGRQVVGDRSEAQPVAPSREGVPPPHGATSRLRGGSSSTRVTSAIR